MGWGWPPEHQRDELEVRLRAELETAEHEYKAAVTDYETALAAHAPNCPELLLLRHAAQQRYLRALGNFTRFVLEGKVPP
jgi:hypothetical protein